MSAHAIKISINALGGQGGGVLSNWLVDVGEKAGYIPQSTSVPGVAQRTGATVYYVELFPLAAAQAAGKTPILALMPIAGDVDIVVASELMEAGRAISRGIVTKKTTLITSSHRIYAVDEKTNMSDGRHDSDKIKKLAKDAAGALIMADLQVMAETSGTVISAVLFGAIAGSGALPIAREIFEEVIRESGRGVEASLRGFDLGYRTAKDGKVCDQSATPDIAFDEPLQSRSALDERINTLPAAAQYFAKEGVRKLVDYQGEPYANEYLDILDELRQVDEQAGGERRNWSLLNACAKHLALWMAYEDTIRVADLKTRASRFERFREEVRADHDQIVHVSEYMHPRVEEVCDMLPSGIATFVLNNRIFSRVLKFFLGDGRRVSTTKLRGFLVLYLIAGLRFLRPISYRHKLESARIDRWLSLVKAWSEIDYAAAVNVVKLQRLIKGYGETHERGLASFERIVEVDATIRMAEDPSEIFTRLTNAALADEEGAALQNALLQLEPSAKAA